MDTDILIDNKDCLYGDDILEHFAKEYQWSSLLDATDASPSEILADAAPILVPPISPVISVKSSPTESSNSDSGSEDDSKNGSTSTSERHSSQSPFDWMTNFDDEPPANLNLEDVEQFLQKTVAITNHAVETVEKKQVQERFGPVMAIENGVIKGIGLENITQNRITTSNGNNIQNGNINRQNSYFKVVNENTTNSLLNEENKIVLSEQIQLVVEQKKVPAILKRPVVTTKPPSLTIPPNNTEGGKITISPLLQTVKNGIDNCIQIKVSTNQNVNACQNFVASNANATVQNIVITNDVDCPKSPELDATNLSDAEIRLMKKQQRMIKNRESACQSRQKKKEYVTALEQQLLEAHQEIARLRLENKLLRDQLDSNGRSRKIPRLDASFLIPKKNIAVIFAMVFMVSLNFNVLGWSSKPFVSPTRPQSNTRHLLWTEDSPEISQDYDQPYNRSIYGTDCNSTKANDVYMNQTESIRIVGELNKWIGGGKTLNWTNDMPRKIRSVYVNDGKINGGLLETYNLLNKLNIDNLVDFPTVNRKTAREKDRARLRRLRRSKEVDFTDNAVYGYDTLYHKPIRQVHDITMGDFGEWNALLQALERRDDTFYVVGVGKGEHLLLPAVSHNDTKPPKMALILPAKSGNESIMNDHVTLMQIDCSVVNTTLVKLKSEALPESLRKKSSEVIKAERKLESKRNTYLRRPKVPNDTLPEEHSRNISNYPLKSKKSPNELGTSKEDLFSQYLMSKYDESKNDSKSDT